MGAWVLLEPNKEQQTEGEVRGGGQNKSQVSWEVPLKKEDPRSAVAGEP